MATPKTIPELGDVTAPAFTSTHYMAVHKDGEPEANRVRVSDLPILLPGAPFFRKYIMSSAVMNNEHVNPIYKRITVSAIYIAPDNTSNADGEWFHCLFVQDKVAGKLDCSAIGGITVGNVLMVLGEVD